jgi:hypothetical protein
MAITSLSTSSLVSGVKRRRVWDQTATTDGFFQIATTTLNVSAASITFSSIPQDYTHLQIRAIGRYTAGGTGSEANNMQFNGDTTFTNYRNHLLYGDGGGTAAATNDQSSTYAGVSFNDFWRGGEASGIFATIIYDILDYTNTNKNKVVRSLNGFEKNASGGNVRFNSGVWLNTSAITSIRFIPANGLSYAQYTNFALYGIKG